jgi:hypothetical protein
MFKSLSHSLTRTTVTHWVRDYGGHRVSEDTVRALMVYWHL